MPHFGKLSYTVLSSRMGNARACKCGKRRPSFGFDGETRASCCSACKENGMVNITSRRCQCGKRQPIYGKEGDARASCCSMCKEDGMVNIVSPRCKCNKAIPVFGHEGDTRASCCSGCKENGMVNIKSRRCQCGKSQPSFGNEGDARASRCFICKDDGMVDVKSRKCKCGMSQPSFGNECDTRASRCSACKEANMVNIVSRRCKCGQRQPIFGNAGDVRASCCSTCKEDGMIDIKGRKCKCGTSRPVFGFHGDTRASCCFVCKEDDMIDIESPRCKCGACVPSFGFDGDKRPTRCATCKEDGMMIINARRCASSECNTHVQSSMWFPYCARCYATMHPDDPLVKERNKTEGKIFHFLCASLGGHNCVARNVKGTRAPQWAGAYELDFLLAPCMVNIECDGGQHFEHVAYFGNHGNLERDTLKTTLCVSNGVSVIRVIQKDIWHEKYDWKLLLRSMISFAVDAFRKGTPVVLFGTRDGDDTRYASHMKDLQGNASENAYFTWMETPEIMLLQCPATGERVQWRGNPEFSLMFLEQTVPGCRVEGRIMKQAKLQQFQFF